MSIFELEEKFAKSALFYNKTCIVIVSSVFCCVVLGTSFRVCYGENDLKSNIYTSKYVDKYFFENIKSHKQNVWFGVETGISYMRLEKVWREALPAFSDDSAENISGTSSSISQNTLQEKTLPLHQNKARDSTVYKPTVVSIDILKFNPHAFDFSVYSASWSKGDYQTLAGWSTAENLIAAINASMFLPDGITSNGYLRKGALLNNKRQGTRLGGFFVADPKKPQTENTIVLPPVAIIYRDDPKLSRFTADENIDLEAILDKYNVVVQNFRLLEIEDDFENTKLSVQNTPQSTVQEHCEDTPQYTVQGTVQEHCEDTPQDTQDSSQTFFNDIDDQSKNLDPKNINQVTDKSQKNTWNSSRRHSIAAIAEDANGNILFLHSQVPVTIQNFINAIKNDSTLNLRRALYTEGGGQASMSLTVKHIEKYWLGQNSIFLMFTGQNRLPNIIGVKRK